ncbi:CRP-like cAMP-binding protein [Limimaricola variabilis]|uniref:CRP-like cAMP-binding protein n=1 Tax=Limimaricola variabilis TaxID=1492771 RepID=A0ABR6HJP1_9RHOB|nr:Crp/Fnr family transcriptional regulator [Limimaricola variabilis]MBB3710769.1 CRP-like cAMP-binding protein [Limimaricola variabilis]
MEHPIDEIVFPVSGILSVVARGPGGHAVEAGLVGCDGMSGHMLLLGGTESVHDAMMQIGGHGWRLPAEALRMALKSDEELRDRLLRYVQTVLVQLSHSALAYGKAVIDVRLARWLLMCQDRLGRDQLDLTHEFLALMLGVRRSGVTVALHRLEGDGLVRSRRGSVVIRDRAGLEELAADFYGVPEAHYQRLLGVPLRC